MIIVGLTGGIGSGKTTVAGFFKELGIPIYIADEEAKKLMNTSKVLIKNIKKLFGDNAYVDEKLNRPYIAKKIFSDARLLEKMNALVHPKVAKHFEKWVKKQQAPYVIKEAAILFESGSHKNCDFTITVITDEALKIERLLKRDETTESKIRDIMKHQWSDEKKMELSDFTIINNTLEDTKKQVLKIHHKLLKSIH